MDTAFKIAALRARMVASVSFDRAVRLMIEVGICLQDAARFVLSVLRMKKEKSYA